MLGMLAFLLQKFFNSMYWCKSATLKIANLAILNHYMVLLNQCMELKKVFNNKAVISSIVKVPFSKNISGMTQCPSNPGFASTKLQNVDFLKKPSVDNIFFLFTYVLLTYHHHLRAKLGMYIALCIFLNFRQVWVEGGHKIQNKSQCRIWMASFVECSFSSTLHVTKKSQCYGSNLCYN